MNDDRPAIPSDEAPPAPNGGGAPDALLPRLDEFVGRLDLAALFEETSRSTGLELDIVERRVRTYLAEARVGLRVVAPLLRPGIRVLEIGSGVGVVSSFLGSIGLEVAGVEPGGGAFDLMPVAAGVAERQWGSGLYERIDTPIEEVATSDRSWDVAFSANVLEHVDDVGRAIGAIHECLGEDGVSRHQCPNYSVPYEPHFGIPLLPVRPALTARLLPPRVADSALWRSLNFVTAREVRDITADLGLAVHFDDHVMKSTIDRLLVDESFAARHARLAQVARAVDAAPGVDRLLTSWPVSLSTPMVFTIARASRLEDVRAGGASRTTP